MTITNTKSRGRRINFRLVKQARGTLIEFFVRYPHYVSTLEIDCDNAEMWEAIFFHFFNSRPVHDTSRDVPSYYRAGSTDPRWDELFFKMKVLSLCRRLAKQQLRRKFLTSRISLEAA